MEEKTFFSRTLISWYAQNKRDLPWRSTSDPYKIWISEVILQQTRVNQGLDYYYKFIKAFPNVSILAAADIDEVLKLWQGLGYYSRARNLHEASRQIVSQYKGVFPQNFKELLLLKGIGKYTAGAIASIAFNEAVPVVDGNVYRVLSRFLGIDRAIDQTGSYNYYSGLAAELMKKMDPGQFNQAIMELGALVCTPLKPQCENCPVQNACAAYSGNLQYSLPLKSKTKRNTNRYFHYLVILYKGGVYIKKRDGNDIWKGLYDFPLIESQTDVEPENLFGSKEFGSLMGNSKFKIISVSNQFKVKLTHQTLFLRFYKIFLENDASYENLFEWKKYSELNDNAVPACISKYLYRENLIL